MAFLDIRRVAKSFGDQIVLDGVSLPVEEGEVLALLGPSGSGKTTLLRLVAGFERPDEGDLLLDGVSFLAQPAAKRGFGMVFQHYALFPHMTVGENVAFGLHGWGLPRDRVAARVAEVLELVDLTGFEDRSVTRISGGQQQRVALARAIAPKPRLLLLDEPLSNLDPDLRERTRRRLRETLAGIGITTLLVTHEQEEAFDLGDRVAVLAAGRLQQVDRPEALYRRPPIRFVARFVACASLLPGRFATDGRVRVGVHAGEHGVVWRADPATDALEEGAPVEVAVRPEMLELSTEPVRGALTGRVVGSRFVGMFHLAAVELPRGGSVEVASDGAVEPGTTVWVGLRSGARAPRVFAVEGSGARAVEGEVPD